MMRYVVLLFGIAASAFAQTAVKARRALDVKSGAIVENAVVLVDGDKIKAFGSGLAIPAGAKVIDLGDVTLLPGLIDCHTHLLANMEDDDYPKMLLMKSQAYRALEGAAHARKTLLAGFTAVRDVENEGSGYADVALRDAINRGLVEGPRMKVATRAIAVVGQYNPFGISTDLVDFPRGAQMISGVEEARRAAREQLGNGADLIKVYADWRYPTLTVEEMRVVVEEAHKAGKRVAAHATTPEGIRNAVTAGVDSIEHGDRADRETLALMKEKKIWLVPTLAALIAQTKKYPDDKGLLDYIEAKKAMLKSAHDAGVRIALGYDPASAAHHGTNARELAAMTSAGLTNLEAIRAATMDAAELIGWPDRIGTLEAGKLADVIAVPGDPLSDVRQLERVVFVMKGGAVVKAP